MGVWSADLVVIIVAATGIGERRNLQRDRKTDRQTDRDRHTQSCSGHFLFAAHETQAGHRVEQEQQQLANSMGCCKSKRATY